MSSSYPQTFGALKRSPYGQPERALRSVKDELRDNLLVRLARGGSLFEGVVGYEETVMPQIVNALLSRHNLILLGLRGQAKSRIESNGFSSVSELRKDDQGVWRAKATKDGRNVAVSLDFQGNVTSQ